MEALSITALKQLLAHIDHKPQKHLGQNFLVDSNILKKALEWSQPQKGDVFVEIGPGLGTLSQALINAGVDLYAVEKDPILAAYLRESLAPGVKNFHLTEADAVQAPLANYSGSQPCKLLANLPYAIASPWLSEVLDQPQLPQRMVLFLQKEAADRFLAEEGSKERGALSLFLQAAYVALGRHRVSPTCFYPAPQVDSVLLLLERRSDPYRFKPATQACIREFFTQRRKQIGGLSRTICPVPLDNWLNGLSAAGVSPDARPEDLPLWAWQMLDSSF